MVLGPEREATDFVHHADDLRHLADGVDADDVRALHGGGGDGSGGRPIAFGRGAIAASRAEERLARRAHEQRPIERAGDLREPRQHTIAVLGPFGKPDAGVDDHAAALDAGALGGGDRAAKLVDHLGGHIIVLRLAGHRLRAPARVHENERGAVPGRDAGQFGVELQAADVVHDRDAGFERRIRHQRLVGVDRQRDLHARRDPLEDRHHAPQLLVGRHGLGARPRGLAAEIDDVGALGLEPQRARRRLGRIGNPAGERVGRDVEDAHDERPRAEDEGGSAWQRDGVRDARSDRGRHRAIRNAKFKMQNAWRPRISNLAF